jgi:hypothetical protein
MGVNLGSDTREKNVHRLFENRLQRRMFVPKKNARLLQPHRKQYISVL